MQDWCEETNEAVNGHRLRVFTGRPAHLEEARDRIAAIVPTHYASEERVAEILARLGKPKAAQFVREKLPQGKRIRSGDLGEILASEFIESGTTYAVPVKKLRWKDHREMAMRGDDIIGIRQGGRGRLEFLKGEIKSRAALATGVVAEARGALRKTGGLPSPHALSFIADRLREIGNTDLLNAIDDAQLKAGIRISQVDHLLFAFCGNSPTGFLKTDLEAYRGRIPQHSVGLRVRTHQEFIRDVYEKVIANGEHR